MPTPEQIREAVQRHVDLWNGDDHMAWRAGFTEDAIQENPAGTPPRPIGNLRSEWDATHSDQMRTNIELLDCIPSGPEGAALMRNRLTRAGLPDQIFDYIVIWTVTDDGLISGSKVFLPEVDSVLREVWKSD